MRRAAGNSRSWGNLLRQAAAHLSPGPPGAPSGFGSGSAASLHVDSFAVRTGQPRLVVLGTGWAAARLLKDIDPKKFDITVVSPRNHFVFTPLLSSACVGTLETRSVVVPIMDTQRALKWPTNAFYTAEATAVDPEKRQVVCSAESNDFAVEYDVLAVATGSQGSTFGIPGVDQHAHFLRDASHSTAIRSHLIANWSRANTPGLSGRERDRLLSVVVVGGGPTGVEFAGELSDFINSDLRRLSPDRARDMRVSLVEAAELLGSFDARLRTYAARVLSKQGVHLIKGMVKELREEEVELASGEVLPYGLCVWSTGVGPTSFTTALPFARTPKGRLAVDDHLRLLRHPPTAEQAGTEAHPVGPSEPHTAHMAAEEAAREGSNAALEVAPNVYALGDCCANVDNPLPALAQVAEQQGRYLARRLNERKDAFRDDEGAGEPFKYRSLGSMASVGGTRAIIELGNPSSWHLSSAGFASWIAWRSAYLTRLGSIPKRLYTMLNWTTCLLFGRDVSRW